MFSWHFAIFCITTRGRRLLKRLRFEPTSRLREKQDKEQDLFLKIVSSGTFSCNASS